VYDRTFVTADHLGTIYNRRECVAGRHGLSKNINPFSTFLSFLFYLLPFLQFKFDARRKHLEITKFIKLREQKTPIKFTNGENKKTCATLKITYVDLAKPVCDINTCICFFAGKPCAKHTCSQKIKKSRQTFEQKIPTSIGYSLMLSQFT
jgi:hypothetical protein